jgi:hypothetical protein
MRLFLLAVLVATIAACARAPVAPESSDATETAAASSGGSDQPTTPRGVAETYLKALESGDSEDPGRQLLLGGATTNAQLFTLENWRIVSTESPRHEEADLGVARRLVSELDEASREATSKMLSGSGDGSGGVEKITPEVAAELLAPTQKSADRLMAAVPVMGLLLRVGKGLYWHPNNPARALLANAGQGQYQLDLHAFQIETIEGPRKVARRWPLRVFRLKTAQTDTRWKILPGSDWNAE